MKKLTALIILDGLGHSDIEKGNAVIAANPSFLFSLRDNYPHTYIEASGEAVGLCAGEMGNSETGHLNIGGGRIIRQSIDRINAAIDDGSFYSNPAFLAAVNNCKANNSKLHIMGLCSDGGIHSTQNHLYALLKLAKNEGLSDVFVHCFTDGRDKPTDSGITFISELEQKMQELGIGRIATVSGRAYAMDRDNEYKNIQPAYDAMLYGDGITAISGAAAMKASYENGVYDEFVVPTVITNADGMPVAKITENDSVICFNFRSDRMRQLALALVANNSERTELDMQLRAEGKSFIQSKGGAPALFVASMTPYDSAINDRLHIAFPNLEYKNVFGEYISKLGYTQLRIAETQKFAHVTRFFNALVEKAYPGEDRILIPSLAGDARTVFLNHPEMSAHEITKAALEKIASDKYDVMILNFANPDMVGHTGDFDAACKAVSTVDMCLKQVVTAIQKAGGRVIVTADHGNCDEMIDHKLGCVSTYHSTAPVPFILVDDEHKNAVLKKNGALCDIAPTMLDLMGEPVPEEMSGQSLILSK